MLVFCPISLQGLEPQWGGLTLQVLVSALSCVRQYSPWYHPSEGKGGRLLGCSTAEAFSAAVWQHGQPQTLPVIKHPGTVSALRLWGMHSSCGASNRARTALKSIYDRYLRHICGVKYTTPSAMLLEELGLSPLQIFWWQRDLAFWNKLVDSPVRGLTGSQFHTILLDNLDDAFSVGRGARNFSGSMSWKPSCPLAAATSFQIGITNFLTIRFLA